MSKIVSTLTLAVLLSSLCLAQQAPAVHVDLKMADFRVAETSSDHIRIGVHALVRSPDRARITRLAIDNTYLNGMPVFLSAVEEPFEVPANEFVELPGELTATVYYRDVDNPDPLEQLLQSGSVTVDGEATVTVQLNLAQKVALLANTATSKVPVHVVIPISLPGGELGRSAALMALRAARPLFGAARKASAAAGIGPRSDPWQDEIKRKYRDTLLYVISRYQLRDKHGAVTDYTYIGTGFRIAPAHFVLLKEAAEPWNFNPEAIARMKSNGAEVVGGSVEIAVYAPGDLVDAAHPGFSLRRGDFRLISEGKERHKRIFVKSSSGFKKGNLDTRAGHGNIAVFEFSAPVAIPASLDFAKEPDVLQPMAILRFAVPQPGKPLEVEVIAAGAERNGDALQLTDPVDTRSFGSPVVVSSGILAQVQDERTASLLRPSLKQAGYALVN